MAISFVFLSFGALQFGGGYKDPIIGHHLFPHEYNGLKNISKLAWIVSSGLLL